MTSFNKESSPLSGMEDKQKPENRLSFRQRIVPLPLPRYQHSLLLLRFSGVHLNVNIPLPLSRFLLFPFSVSLSFYAKQFPVFLYFILLYITFLLFQIFFFIKFFSRLPASKVFLKRAGENLKFQRLVRRLKLYEKGIMKNTRGCEARSS